MIDSKYNISYNYLNSKCYTRSVNAYINQIPVSFLEKQILRDMSEETRVKGISLANDICRNYRREGKFFDEILDEAKEG